VDSGEDRIAEIDLDSGRRFLNMTGEVGKLYVRKTSDTCEVRGED
jgi:hypothetical protein